MRLTVICKKCDRLFQWDASHEEDVCPYCKTRLIIKDVRMSSLEWEKLQKFKKEVKYEKIEAEKTRIVPKQVAIKVEEEEEPRIVVEGVIKKETKEEDLIGRSIVKKGKIKYGSLELTNPDYMILKFTLWTQGLQQKEMTKDLVLSIKHFLENEGFILEKS